MTDRGRVQAAVAGVHDLVAADGGELVLDSYDAGTAQLRLVLDTAECRECVMPRQFLQQVAFDMMRPHLPDLVAVHVHDPREREPEAGA